ncbi:MAG: type II toxin-antitoxin system RelB/DinJ family antitoxin [bacterium]|nr:type II toxin-antitoxin system RelB/DinJ family antitoxin [bacterium]
MEAVINIKTKRDLKTKAQEVASELGLSLSAVLNGFLRQFVRNKAVHFSLVPRMSQELEDIVGKAEYDIHRKRNLSKAVSSQIELENYFNSL